MWSVAHIYSFILSFIHYQALPVSIITVFFFIDIMYFFNLEFLLALGIFFKLDNYFDKSSSLGYWLRANSFLLSTF